MTNKLHLVCCFSLLFLPIAFSSSIDKRKIIAYKPGHVILGGLFPAHLSWREKCAGINMKGIALIEAMMYAVNKVNSGNLLPCKLTLGYDVRDTCDTRKIALKHALDFLSGEHYSSVNKNIYGCGEENSYSCDGKLISIIGAGNTELSISVNKLLSVFDIPQVGYASTSGILSDKSRFPSFSRTVVVGSDRPQVIVKILTHFDWRHIGLLVSNDMHWKSLALEFKNLASALKICLEIDEFISDEPKAIENIINLVRSSNGTDVIVLFASFLDAKLFFKKASDINLTGKMWINSELLPPDVVTKYGNTLEGMIAIEREPEAVSEFAKYFTNLSPLTNKWNPWFKMLWEKLFNCHLTKTLGKDKYAAQNDTTTCSGKESFKWVGQILSFSHAIHVIDAVMAATNVIKNICQDICTNNATNTRDQCFKKLTKNRILKEIFKGPFVFKSLFGKTVSLDKNGNAAGYYGVFHVKQTYKGIHFHGAGLYKSSDDKLFINDSVISWPRRFEPVKRCGTNCNSGYYRDFEGSKCCWKCKRCSVGSFSKGVNSNKCTTCPADSTSNSEKTSCQKTMAIFFNWGTSGGLILTIVSLASFFISFIVFCVLLKFKTSPVVCSWGSNVNFYLICSVSIGVLIPFAFIGYPTDIMCKLQAVIVPSTLTMSFSLVLVKVRQISCKKENMISRWRVLSYAQKQTIYALFFTKLEILFCILWIIINPPHVKVINGKEKLVLCSNQNASWYVLSFFYIITISLFITIKSCKSRNRSFNFSEAKYISYAMIFIYIIWAVFVAVFIGTATGFHHVTLLCLTVICTQVLILAFVFLPKIFILLYRPEIAKLCDFQMDDEYMKDQTGYDIPNSPRHLHPNGILRSNSSLREDSSIRGTPSQMSLDLTHAQNTPAKNPSLMERIAEISCCAAILRDDESSVASEQQRSYTANPLSPRGLPLIKIDEGTRSNSPRSQISERTFIPNPSRRDVPKTLEDQEQECLSATMDDTEIWSKRRSMSNSRHKETANNEDYYLRFTLKESVIENKHSRQSNRRKNIQLRESRL